MRAYFHSSARLMQLVLLKTVELAMVAHDLQKVSHLVDWEKLHDEYLIAIYSDDPSSSRQLKKRAARPRHQGQRKKEWNVASIEENLEKEALQAIEQAKGFAAPKNSGGGGQEGSGSSVIETAVNVAQDVDVTHSVSDPTTDEKGGQDAGEPSPSSPSTIAPVGSLAPVDPTSTATNSGGDRAADGDEFPISARNSTGGTVSHAKQTVRASDQQGNDASFNGKPIQVYVPSKGNCPGDGDVAVIPIPCAPDNLNQICNKYDPAGSFSACFDACKPSFCCIHGKRRLEDYCLIVTIHTLTTYQICCNTADAPPESNQVAPNCNKDVNCAQYGICYIAWWKLHDTVGPATQLQLEQNDDFFDIDASTISEDQTNSEFYREMLFHHFDNSSAIVSLGSVKVNATLAVFSSDLIFLNETYWNTTI